MIRPIFKNIVEKGDSQKLVIALDMGFRDAKSIPEEPIAYPEEQFKPAYPPDVMRPGDIKVGDWVAEHETTADEFSKYQAKTNRFYLWGAFKYRDALDLYERGPHRFCEWISADDALAATDLSADGQTGGYGYRADQPFHPCHQIDKLPLP